MRVTVWALLALALLSFAAAAIVAGTRGRASASTTAPGVVRQLLDGPHHALVEVSPANGAPFTFPANTQGGLAPAQRVTVRYEVAMPRETAQVVTAGDDGDDRAGTVRGLVVVGVALLVAAALSPLLVRWFPGLLGFRVRP